MVEKTPITTVSDALSFAIVGFGIVFLVLLIVIACVVAILKIEAYFEKKSRPADMPEVEEQALEPLTLVLISAAVATVIQNARVVRIRRIGSEVRHGGSWRSLGYNSHNTRK